MGLQYESWGHSNSGGDASGVDLTNVVDISCGMLACVALKADGTAVAWGYSTYGGDASSVDLTNVVDISCGRYACVALKTDRTAVAWGDSRYGGDASSVDLTNVLDISCGWLACVARKADGTAVAWGHSMYGGDASSVDLTNVADISCGEYACVARYGSTPSVSSYPSTSPSLRPTNQTPELPSALASSSTPSVSSYPSTSPSLRPTNQKSELSSALASSVPTVLHSKFPSSKPVLGLGPTSLRPSKRPTTKVPTSQNSSMSFPTLFASLGCFAFLVIICAIGIFFYKKRFYPDRRTSTEMSQSQEIASTNVMDTWEVSPNEANTRHILISARFDGGEKEQVARSLHKKC